MYIKTISESKYQTFKQCKLKYSFRYVDRLPEPQEANTEALHFGSYIHKVLEDGVNATTREELVTIAEEVKGSYDDPNGSHVTIYCVAEEFEGKRSLARQQMVFKAIWEEMQGPVHAVDTMVLKAPSEL